MASPFSYEKAKTSDMASRYYKMQSLLSSPARTIVSFPLPHFPYSNTVEPHRVSLQHGVILPALLLAPHTLPFSPNLHLTILSMSISLQRATYTSPPHESLPGFPKLGPFLCIYTLPYMPYMLLICLFHSPYSNCKSLFNFVIKYLII